jgi:hypothetical protein
MGAFRETVVSIEEIPRASSCTSTPWTQKLLPMHRGLVFSSLQVPCLVRSIAGSITMSALSIIINKYQ